jgi:hypothetical protein
MTTRDELREAADDSKDDNQGENEKDTKRTAAIGRIAVALVIAWTALIAIPGAVPWAAADDTARALALGIGIATIVALVGLALAWVRTDQLGVEGATFGTAAALAALGLAALEVVNLMLVPEDAPYRRIATGIGLLILIAIALFAVAAIRTAFFEGFRLSSISLVGTILGLVVVGVYLLMIQSMFIAAGPDTQDAEWLRLTTLLTGVQTLAFAGAGALLGTAVQGQVTSTVRGELEKSDTALDELQDEVKDATQKIHDGSTATSDEIEEGMLVALDLDPTTFRSDAARRRYVRQHLPSVAGDLEEVAQRLDRAVERSGRIRAG